MSGDIKTVPCQHDESYKVDPRDKVPYVPAGRTQIFRIVKPDKDMHFSSIMDGYTSMSDDQIEVVKIRNCRACLQDFLEKMIQEPDSVKDFFVSINYGPGLWPGPRGCIHYMMTVHPTLKEAFGWLDYAYDFEPGPNGYGGGWEKQTPQEYLARIKPLVKEAYERIEARPAAVSLVGGYNYLLDGCFHYCSSECALLRWKWNWDPEENQTSEPTLELELSQALSY